MMRYGSVCSGIEAASQAWGVLGWQPQFFSEIEAFPSAVLAHHYPNVPNHGDMTKFKDWPDHAIDLLVGGTPCQSFSVAGLRAGLADPRGNLMLTYLAVAAKYQPRWLLWENVPGVLSSAGGRDFGSFLGGLGELGYGFSYRVLDAQFCRALGYAGAVPQRRRRVFVVGYLGDWRRAAAVLFDAASLRGDSAPRRESGQGIAPTISARTKGGGGLGTDFDLAGGLIASTGSGAESAGKRGYAGRRQEDDVNILAYNITPSNSNKDFNARPAHYAQALTANGGAPSARGGDVIAQPLTLAFNPKAGGNKTIGKSYLDDGSTYTLDTDCTSVAVQQAWAVRRLTPVECCRLQGFPDDYFDGVTYRGKKPADGPIYKALGNSMAVNVMRVLGTRIAMVDAIAQQARSAA